MTEPHLLTVPEVRKILRIGNTTLFHLLKVGKIYAIRIGRKVLIPMSEIERIASEGVTLTESDRAPRYHRPRRNVSRNRLRRRALAKAIEQRPPR